MTMILILMACRIQGRCMEEERNALLEIKTSLTGSYNYVVSPLPSWVDDDGGIGDDCCGWERVTCNTTTHHVTHLSLGYMIENAVENTCMIHWSLNVSLFLHFKEITSLNLSRNCLDSGIVNTGLRRLSSLKKLETLDLSTNTITIETFPSLGALTSLRALYLSTVNDLEGSVVPTLALDNLEILDLSYNSMKGFEHVSLLKKLKILNLVNNQFNKSFIRSLSTLPLLKSLNLSCNVGLSASFPVEELAYLTNMEELDLSANELHGTPSNQDCKRLSRLKKLKSLTLRNNNFNKRIISCLRALPSLNTLDLSYNSPLGRSFPIQELSHLPRDFKGLLLSSNNFNGTLPMEALASLFHRLEVLDLSCNNFVGSISSRIQELSSLRIVSFANNKLNGSLPHHGLCELKNLHELDLSRNMFDGSLPDCFNHLSSLKLLDISSNHFTGILTPSPIANMTSLEYIDFSTNSFEGSFSFSSLSNNTKLEVVRFISNNIKFEVETEEPIGWIPMFQLKVLVLSSCNMNRPKGSVFPTFLLHQRKLLEIDISHNSLVGRFPNWLIENNTMLKFLNLRNNSFNGTICMPLSVANTMWWLDISGNHMNGTITDDIQKFFPKVNYLNLSSNSLDGAIPPSICNLSELWVLDLSNNEFSGEVPKGLFSNLPLLSILKLSKNKLHGDILSGNLSLGSIRKLHLDSNNFTGKIGNGNIDNPSMLQLLDIGNNSFTGTIPQWIGDSGLFELVVRNNSLEGEFPCGIAPFVFLDISQNCFSGTIPSCLNFQTVKHLHLGSNRFTGSIPNVFRKLTDVLTLNIGNNLLSGRIPKFLGRLSDLRILILRNNNFNGSIPKQLCQLSNVSLMDISSNSLSGSIPKCLQNITTPNFPAFIREYPRFINLFRYYNYQSSLRKIYDTVTYDMMMIGTQDDVYFTIKALSLSYKGSILDYVMGLDLSSNKLTGEIPEELGSLIKVQSLNLSHNRLFGPIPMNFSNLEKIESLDLSSNHLSGEVPSQLLQLNYLSFFNVSNNNLSGRLPDMKAQFGTFTKESYEGNPLLCGLPLEKKCTPTSQVIDPSAKEGIDKWYDIDMASFYGSSGSAFLVFLLGFAAVLYINPYWRRRWLDLVEECMYACYYFLDNSKRKLFMLFHK